MYYVLGIDIGNSLIMETTKLEFDGAAKAPEIPIGAGLQRADRNKLLIVLPY